MRVPVMTLDELVEQYGQPAFCKIDVEGYELEVLKGLSQALACISFEYIPAASQIALDCIERLSCLGQYEFNRAAGESMRLQSDGWIGARETISWLKRLPADGASGDIYARLIHQPPAGGSLQPD
jgi:hypothetical protein